MTASALCFIPPPVLQRLITGQFVPQRQQVKSYPLRDRRNRLSALNVLRKILRYEPLVFSTHTPRIIEAAKALNTPDCNVCLISGPNGRGKTAFARALTEMMAEPTQLLWFDVSRHTDYEDIIQFLVEYLTYLCGLLGLGARLPKTQNPIETLENLLGQASHIPFLVVLDNIEFLVAPNQTFRARQFRDALQFLLSFPNVKLMLMGQQLAPTELRLLSENPFTLTLPTLSVEQSRMVLNALMPEVLGVPEGLEAASTFFQGEPYRLNLWARLRHSRSPETSSPPMAGHPDAWLLGRVLERLSPEEKTVLHLLSFLRHGLSLSGIRHLIKAYDPNLATFDLLSPEHTPLRWLLKKVYPPQLVLSRLRARLEEAGSVLPMEGCYQVIEAFQNNIAMSVPQAEQSRIHEVLQAFYLSESERHLSERFYAVKSPYLTLEAQYHASRLRQVTSTPEPIPQTEVPVRPRIGPEHKLSSVPEPRLNAPRPKHASPIRIQRRLPEEAVEVRLNDTDLQKLARYITPAAEGSTTPASVEAMASATGASSPEPPPEKGHEPLQLLIELLQAPFQSDTLAAIEEALATALPEATLPKGSTSEDVFKSVLRLGEERHHPLLQVLAHRALAQHLKRQYHYQDALIHLKAMAHLFETTPLDPAHTELLAESYRERAEIAAFYGDTTTAQAAYEHSLRLGGLTPEAQSDSHLKLAELFEQAQLPDEAIAHYRESIRSSRKAGLSGLPALFQLGSLYFGLGNLRRAHLMLRLAYRTASALEDAKLAFHSLLSLSELAMTRENSPAAERYAQQALEKAMTLLDKTDCASAYVQLGDLAQRQTAWQKADQYYAAAETIAQQELSTESTRWIRQKRDALKEFLS